MRLVLTDRDGNVHDKLPELTDDVYVLGMDSSTSRTGLCVASVQGRLAFVAAVERGAETVAEYKAGLKKILTNILRDYKIKHAIYEEPFVGFMGDVKGLYMISSSLEEVLAESGLDFWVTAVNNKRWKRQFLDRKLEGGSEIHKKQVRAKAIELVPALSVLEKYKKDYDETDAFGLAYYLAKCVRDDVLSSIASQGKPRKFAYKVTLFGGCIAAEDALKSVGKPRKDGVIIADISTKRTFDSAVFELMQGKNAILLLYFKSGKFGNLILEHGGGELAAKNDTLSAVVTRKVSSKAASKT